jgi:predicted DNA-binding protein (MmcQ/YjbR family)
MTLMHPALWDLRKRTQVLCTVQLHKANIEYAKRIVQPYHGHMRWDELLAYCLAKPGAWPDEPWGDGVVAKVGPKIFAFLGAVGPDGAAVSVGLKCGTSRDGAGEWLLRYPGDAAPSPYIGRSGWNSLRVGGAIPDDEIFEAIDGSYAMVVSKLPKKERPGSLPLLSPLAGDLVQLGHGLVVQRQLRAGHVVPQVSDRGRARDQQDVG